jgi:arabinan endo-1,5-alpha-L-arabinosidase
MVRIRIAARMKGCLAHVFCLVALASGALTIQSVAAQPLPAVDAAAPRVHDPSTIVHCKDEYWLFATGRGVRSLHSKDRVNWKPGPPVFSESPAWITEVVPGNSGYFWAPDVIRVNGRYLLYYSVSTWGKNTSAIALATNPTLDPADPGYCWADEGIVIRSTAADDFNAIDPSVLLDAKGRLWMAFGSFWTGIKLVQLDPVTGKRLAPDSPLYSLARHESIEAACLYQRGGYHYLFVNWGLCCRGAKSTYEIRVGRSTSITGPYLDRNGVDLLHDGGSVFLSTAGPLIGPGHAGILTVGDEQWLSCHFYDGNNDGRPTLALRKLRWTADGWPSLAEPQELMGAARPQQGASP